MIFSFFFCFCLLSVHLEHRVGLSKYPQLYGFGIFAITLVGAKWTGGSSNPFRRFILLFLLII